MCMYMSSVASLFRSSKFSGFCRINWIFFHVLGIITVECKLFYVAKHFLRYSWVFTTQKTKSMTNLHKWDSWQKIEFALTTWIWAYQKDFLERGLRCLRLRGELQNLFRSVIMWEMSVSVILVFKPRCPIICALWWFNFDTPGSKKKHHAYWANMESSLQVCKSLTQNVFLFTFKVTF